MHVQRMAGLAPALMALTLILAGADTIARTRAAPSPRASPTLSTAIEHLVVIFPENESFDHYFGTYPVAANPPGEPAFLAAPDTPAVNGLAEPLLTRNPNAHQPFRLDRVQAYVCDQSASYVNEQRAYNRGLLDRFVEPLADGPRPEDKADRRPGAYCANDGPGTYYTVMGYFDGNTVTALWNYAQRFALSDNFFGTMFGQSTPGHLNLVAADTAGVLCGPAKRIYGDVPPCGATGAPPAASTVVQPPSGARTGTLFDDVDPLWDICSTADAAELAALRGPTIGDLLSEEGITWGWFQGGFALNSATGRCDSRHPLEAYDRALGVDPATDTAVQEDYIPHHAPFQYFASTANPRHLPPTSVAMIGRDDQANHQYDLAHFWQAAEAGNLPAVSFLKPPGYQDGHPGRSDALDEQQFLVETINRLQRLPEWRHMAIIIAYDDSDGWYDHVMPPIINRSNTPLDTGCGDVTQGAPARCGYGPRLPLLLVSPYAKRNHVSHALIDQTSITRFIEDRWLGGRRLSDESFDALAGPLDDLFDATASPAPPLILDPLTGLPQ